MKKVLAVVLCVMMAAIMLPFEAFGASWLPTDRITITVDVLDVNTGVLYTNVGTDSVTKGDQYIQSDAYRIPSLSRFTSQSHGMVMSVHGNFYGSYASGGCNVGTNVRFSCNSNTARITYYVAWFGSGSSGGGQNSNQTITVGPTSTGRYSWSQTVVFHSNYPNGTDYTYTVYFSASRYWANIYNTSVKSFASMGFTTPSGYTLRDRVWDTNRNGTGTNYGNGGLYPFRQSDNGKTIHLWAQYVGKAVNDYTLTYMDGGSQVGIDTVIRGNSAELMGALLDTDTHTFAGWSTQSAATTVTHTANQRITPTSDMTFYAVWNLKQTGYTVTYDANGGTGTMTDPLSYNAGDDVTVMDNGFTAPADHHFLEFNTEPDGSGEYFDPEDTFEITEDVTLYAIWVENSYITIIPDSAILLYTGQDRVITGYSLDCSDLYTVTGVTVMGVGKDVKEGGYPVEVTCDKSDLRVYYYGTDVTEMFSFIFETGIITITPRSIEITANSQSRAYDGLPLTANGYKVTDGSFVEGEGFANVTVEGEITGKGTVANVITGYAFAEGTLPANYEITTVDGLLEITAIGDAIDVTANSESKQYNGNPLTNNGYSFTEGVLLEGDELVVEIAGTITNAGSAANEIVSVKVMRGTVDVTDCYTIGTLTNGTLTITPIAIEITADSASGAYNGLPLTANGYTVTGGSFIEGEGFATVTVSGEITNAGSTANTVAGYTFAEGTVSDNYDITTVDGILEITPISIEITANSLSRVYNGLPLTANGYTVTSGAFVAGEGFANVTVSGSITNVGSTANRVTGYTLRDNTLADNYVITTADGQLSVSRRAIIIYAQSGSLPYTGAEQTVEGFDVSNLVNGHEIRNLTASGSLTNVGVGAVTFEGGAEIYAGAANVTGNYAITLVDGSIEITPIPVIITVGSFEKESGADDPTFIATVTGAVNSSDIAYTLSRVEGEVIGSYAITASFEENPNYVITVIDGTLTIIPVRIIDPPVPPLSGGSWAWVNLLLTVLTGLGALLMIAQFIFGKSGKKVKAGNPSAARFLSLIPTAGAVVAFLLTEDMSLPMIATDKWTILMGAILAVQVAFYFIIRQDKFNDKQNRHKGTPTAPEKA